MQFNRRVPTKYEYFFYFRVIKNFMIQGESGLIMLEFVILQISALTALLPLFV